MFPVESLHCVLQKPLRRIASWGHFWPGVDASTFPAAACFATPCSVRGEAGGTYTEEAMIGGGMENVLFMMVPPNQQQSRQFFSAPLFCPSSKRVNRSQDGPPSFCWAGRCCRLWPSPDRYCRPSGLDRQHLHRVDHVLPRRSL